MAFEPKDLQIIPRGINLVPPGDQVAEGDCLELTGWWPGSLGRLEQDRGWVLKNVAGGVGSNLDMLSECQGRVYYGGNAAGVGYLYQVGRDTAGVWLENDFDGYPLGMCAYQSIQWIMNRAHQRRDDGTTTTDWGTEVPGAMSAASVASGGGLADGTHDYYVTFVDIYGYEGNPSPVLEVVLPAGAFSTGTVAVDTGSATIVLSGGTWTSGITGQTFQVAGDTDTYILTYVDATHATLNTPYTGASNGAASFAIFSPANAGTATLTRPTAATPALIAGWNVYRQSPGSGSIYQVNTTMIAYGTSTYQDFGDEAHQQDQESLIEEDVVMEADHDPPPAARILAAIPFNGRILAANSAQYPNRIWFTRPLEPNYFPGSADPQSGNWVDVGNDSGDQILHISVKVGYLVIYRQRSIWQHSGDLGDPSAVLSPLIPNMGIVGPRAVVSTSTGDIAVVKQGLAFGLYRVTDWEQRVGAKVEPILNGLGAENYSAINPAAASTCALGYQLGRLWFSYPDGSNTYPNRLLIYDVEQDTFSYSVSGRWFSRIGSFGAFLHGSLFFLGASTGKVYSLIDGGSEDGSATPLAYQSQYLDVGFPDHEKTWGDLVLSHNTQGAAWTVSIRLNKGADIFNLKAISSSSLTRQEIPLIYPVGHANAGQPIESFNLSIRVAGSGATTLPGGYIDTPILLHYLVKPRRATTWDSGPTDHGMTGAKVVDMVEIDCDGGPLLLYYQSDIPGGQLVERSSGTTGPGGQGTGSNGLAIIATTGRQVVRVPLPSTITGRLLRYQLYSPSGNFLLYRFRVRALPVGQFVDGTMGDTWYTEPIAAGSAGVAPVYEAARRERLPQEI
jgi:hypothetical protein